MYWKLHWTLLQHFLIHIVIGNRIDHLLENLDIKNTWTKSDLILCTNPRIPFENPELHCETVISQHFTLLDVEYLSIQPVLIRFHKFGNKTMLKEIQNKFRKSDEVEEQVVEGAESAMNHRGRVADGLWLEPHEECILPLFHKIQQNLRLNPAIAENFLILKYDKNGHYAPHYDHLFPMTIDYDNGWFEYFGNRMATALLIVQPAEVGGGTVFPNLELVVQPGAGDLLLWFNADSNDDREYNSLHAGCPIEKGQKMAVSLWLRGNFQDQLYCPTYSSRYTSYDMIKQLGSKRSHPQFDTRPQIPREYGGYWDDEDYDDDGDGSDILHVV
ncbi:unnamed protein product [Bursaphelenchus okinawaensis]|uniref:Fe2OG dioxygenase domain-containing protein n=1 Tax=Bursaphelenchus okinawaensis TaxID=465554 RepID=A0A811L2E5_9BILA|nr:unnamed protein product [Bursaphelenchus okinawaensis]CAG9117406.1 unnamed protein product [Bursaphelenchus okinawaensis]